MIQTYDMEAFGGQDPAVVTWSEAFKSWTEVVSIVPEAVEAIANSVGEMALKAVNKLAS